MSKGDDSPACNMSPSQDKRTGGGHSGERERQENEWEVS